MCELPLCRRCGRCCETAFHTLYECSDNAKIDDDVIARTDYLIAKAKNSEVYLNGLHGLRKQLEADLGREDLGFVIGRLSDSGFYRRRDKKSVENSDWKGIRDAQEEFANSVERAVWIDADDLNEVILFLKNDTRTKFRQLIDVTAVDYPEKESRFPP